MKEQTDKNIPSAAAAASTEPEITILADDVGSDRDKNLAASLGVQLPLALINGPVSEFIQEGSDEFGRKTSFIGEIGQKLLNKFLGERKSEWESLQQAEREKQVCASRFQFYTNALAELKLKTDMLRGEIEYYKGADLADTIFENCFKAGHQIRELFSAPASTEMLATLCIQRHGDAALKKMEDEIGAMAADFSKFKQTKRVVLKELGLI